MMDFDGPSKELYNVVDNVNDNIQIPKFNPATWATEIVKVQPMDEAGKAWKELYEASAGNTEETLRAEGFTPVSDLRIMWVKDE